jgi:hypothetical protein
VAEPEALGFGGEQLGADRLAQAGHDRGLVQPGHGGQQRPVEAAAEHGGGVQQIPGRRRQHLQAPADRVGEGRGHVRTDRAGGGPASVLLDQQGRAHQPGQQLIDQERQPVGGGAEPALDSPRQRGRAQAGPGHVDHGRLLQPLQRHHGGGPAGGQGGGQLAAGGALLGAERGQAEDPLAGQVVGQVLEHGQGLGVGPVQVLQDQQAATVAGQGAQQPQDPLAEHDQGLGAVRGLPRPPFRDQPPQGRPERPQLGEVGEAAPAQLAQDRLGQRPERHRPRLARPGLPDDHRGRPATRDRPVQRLQQDPELVGPSHQHRAEHLSHAASMRQGARSPSTAAPWPAWCPPRAPVTVW